MASAEGELNLGLCMVCKAICHLGTIIVQSPLEEYTMSTNVKRNRLTIDISPDVKRRLRLIAAHRDVSIRHYVLETIEERLANDWAALAEQEELLALNSQVDPVLVELWDNEKDAAYDAI
jgi:uncharacterized protein (DUF1778 family)